MLVRMTEQCVGTLSPERITSCLVHITVHLGLNAKENRTETKKTKNTHWETIE